MTLAQIGLFIQGGNVGLVAVHTMYWYGTVIAAFEQVNRNILE